MRGTAQGDRDLWMVEIIMDLSSLKSGLDLIQLSATEAVGRMCMQLLHLRAWSLVC